MRVQLVRVWNSVVAVWDMGLTVWDLSMTVAVPWCDTVKPHDDSLG